MINVPPARAGFQSSNGAVRTFNLGSHVLIAEAGASLLGDAAIATSFIIRVCAVDEARSVFACRIVAAIDLDLPQSIDALDLRQADAASESRRQKPKSASAAAVPMANIPCVPELLANLGVVDLVAKVADMLCLSDPRRRNKRGNRLTMLLFIFAQAIRPQPGRLRSPLPGRPEANPPRRRRDAGRAVRIGPGEPPPTPPLNPSLVTAPNIAGPARRHPAPEQVVVQLLP